MQNMIRRSLGLPEGVGTSRLAGIYAPEAGPEHNVSNGLAVFFRRGGPWEALLGSIAGPVQKTLGQDPTNTNQEVMIFSSRN